MTVIPTMDEALEWYLFGGSVYSDMGPPCRWDGILADGNPYLFDEYSLGAPREQIRARIFRACVARGIYVLVGYRRINGQPALEVRGGQVLAWIE